MVLQESGLKWYPGIRRTERKRRFRVYLSTCERVRVNGTYLAGTTLDREWRVYVTSAVRWVHGDGGDVLLL